jgi:hypothetical protein
MSRVQLVSLACAHGGNAGMPFKEIMERLARELAEVRGG